MNAMPSRPLQEEARLNLQASAQRLGRCHGRRLCDGETSQSASFFASAPGVVTFDHALAMTKSLPMLAEDYAGNGASIVSRSALLIRNTRGLIRAGLLVRGLG